MPFIVRLKRKAGRSASKNPALVCQKTLRNIEECPIFLALVDTVGSDGRGIEVEHAYNSGKRVILTTGPNEKLSWVMKEIVAMGIA